MSRQYGKELEDQKDEPLLTILDDELMRNILIVLKSHNPYSVNLISREMGIMPARERFEELAEKGLIGRMITEDWYAITRLGRRTLKKWQERGNR